MRNPNSTVSIGNLTDSNTGRLYSLDLLRFAAAISVTAYHHAPLFERVRGVAGDSPSGFRFGYLGVELFFMISGFVIALSVQGRGWRSFLVHRAIRLYPTFWVSLLISSVLAVTVAGDHVSMRTFVANATMLPGYLGEPFIDGVYWTLGVEWKFYVLMAAVVAAGFHDRLDRVGALWSGVLLFIHAGIQVPGLRSAVMFPYGAYFAFGVLVMDTRLHGLTRLRSLGLALSMAGMLLATQSTYKGFISKGEASDHLVVSAIVLVLSCLFAYLLLSPQRILEKPHFRLLGSTTYPLYLLHAGVGSTLIANWRPVHSIPAVILLSIGITSALVVSATALFEVRLVPRLARSAMISRIAGQVPRLAQRTTTAN